MKIISMLLFLLMTFNVLGQINLLVEEELIEQKGENVQKGEETLLDNTIIKQFVVRFNVESLTYNDYSFNIDGKIFNLNKGNFRKNDFGYEIWSSNIDKIIRNSLITQRDGNFSGFFTTDKYVYEIKPLNTSQHLITKRLINILENECNTQIDTSVHEIHDSKSVGSNTSKSSSTYEIYRIVIAYTPELRATFSNQLALNDFLIRIVEKTNDTYITSNINIRARLAFAYQTPDSENGDKHTDFDDFEHTSSILHPTWEKFDEVFDYIDEYHADVGVLLVSPDVGGQASSSGENLVIYGKEKSDWYYGVAHEIGHLFGLEHGREEFSLPMRILLDPKKAYGFTGTHHGTVMSLNHSRQDLYSDEGLTFWDNETAGDEHAHAKIYLTEHTDNVIENSDPVDVTLSNKTIYSDEMVCIYATNDLEATNYICKNESMVSLNAENSILLLPGFEVESGASFKADVVLYDNSYIFKGVK